MAIRVNEKWNVIEFLLRNNFTLSEIVALKKENFHKGKIENDKKEAKLSDEVLASFGKYLKTFQNKKEKLDKALFPGLNGEPMNEGNLKLGFKSFASKTGRDWRNYGIGRTRVAGKKKVELKTVDDIEAFLKE